MKSNINQKLLISILLLSITLISKSQLLINYRYTHEELVNKVFIKKNSGIKIFPYLATSAS